MSEEMEKFHEAIASIDETLSPGDEHYDAMLFLLAGLDCGANYTKIHKATGLKMQQCKQYARAARQNDIWQGHKISCDWFEEDGGCALLLDAMCLSGVLERSPA